MSFSTARLEAEEDSGNTVTTVSLPLVREVGTTGTVLATVEVSVGAMWCEILSLHFCLVAKSHVAI